MTAEHLHRSHRGADVAAQRPSALLEEDVAGASEPRKDGIALGIQRPAFASPAGRDSLRADRGLGAAQTA